MFTLMFTCRQEDVFQHGYESRVWAELITRLSYIFGLREPLTHSDTASSPSLVAYGLGHTIMRPKTEKQDGRKNRRKFDHRSGSHTCSWKLRQV